MFKNMLHSMTEVTENTHIAKEFTIVYIGSIKTARCVLLEPRPHAEPTFFASKPSIRAVALTRQQVLSMVRSHFTQGLHVDHLR